MPTKPRPKAHKNQDFEGAKQRQKLKRGQESTYDTSLPRIPRPMGATLMARDYEALEPNSPQKQKKLQELRLHYINMYLMTNFQLNGEVIKEWELAQRIGMPYKQVMAAINHRLVMRGKWLNDEVIGARTRAVIFEAQNESLMAHARATNQADMLIAQQGGQYVPFLTEQVNKAIALIPQTIKNLIDSAKSLQPTAPTISILNQQHQEQQVATVNNQQLGPDEAFRVIEAKLKEANLGGHNTPEIKALIGANLTLETLPNIRANTAQEEAIMAEHARAEASRQDTGLTAHEARDFRGLGEVLEEEEELDPE